MKKLTFLHTSPVHVDTFNRMLADRDLSEMTVEHIVDESLLDRARTDGLTPALESEISDTILGAVAQGADVVLCTCSSIGGAAESLNAESSSTILRVDRAMAETAIGIGDRIKVAATLASTVEPTSELIKDAATKANRKIQLSHVVFDDAWACFEAGDQDGYIRAITRGLPNAAVDADVIVLAQGSMAQAAEQCGELGIPVLSSPALGLDAALKALG